MHKGWMVVGRGRLFWDCHEVAWIFEEASEPVWRECKTLFQMLASGKQSVEEVLLGWAMGHLEMDCKVVKMGLTCPQELFGQSTGRPVTWCRLIDGGMLVCLFDQTITSLRIHAVDCDEDRCRAARSSNKIPRNE